MTKLECQNMEEQYHQSVREYNDFIVTNFIDNFRPALNKIQENEVKRIQFIKFTLQQVVAFM